MIISKKKYSFYWFSANFNGRQFGNRKFYGIKYDDVLIWRNISKKKVKFWPKTLWPNEICWKDNMMPIKFVEKYNLMNYIWLTQILTLTLNLFTKRTGIILPFSTNLILSDYTFRQIYFIKLGTCPKGISLKTRRRIWREGQRLKNASKDTGLKTGLGSRKPDILQ